MTLGEDYIWNKFNEISSAEQLEFSWWGQSSLLPRKDIKFVDFVL